MKKNPMRFISGILLMCLFNKPANAQIVSGAKTFFDLTFEKEHWVEKILEDSIWKDIVFEPAENNIWQIGTPSKTILDSAYSGHFALMTDTLNLLKDSLKHSFILKLERPTWAPCSEDWGLYFHHRYSFDSLNSGGYIEVSYDKGITWVNAQIDNYLNIEPTILRYNNNRDTLFNGELGLRGEIYLDPEYNEWNIGSDIVMSFYSGSGSWENAEIFNTIWIKFTYINNGKGKAHEGWLIDDLYAQISHWCEFYDVSEINYDKEVIIYPNPASNYVSFALNMPSNENASLSIFDITGNLIFEMEDYCEHEPLSLINIANGIYMYAISFNNTYYKGKFVIAR